MMILPLAAIYIAFKKHDSENALPLLKEYGALAGTKISVVIHRITSVPGLPELLWHNMPSLMRMASSPQKGYKRRIISETKELVGVDILVCPLHKMAEKLGMPEITEVVCLIDKRQMAGFRHIEYTRTKALGNGDSYCDCQAGKTVIVTGATSGIGYETALVLAKAGATVVLASRNEAKGNKTIEKIQKIYPSAKVSFMLLDTASQLSVRNFCEAWIKTGRKIDCLILNAGISNVPTREESVDGFERQLATNYLGHFTMTALLLPYMNNDGDARIIPVSSLAHKRTHLRFDDLQMKQHYNPMTTYNHSKLAVLTFVLELSRRLQENGSSIKVIPVHPGVASTEITRGGDRMNPIIQKFAKKMFGILGQSAEQGAWSLLYAATSNNAKNGDYYGPSGAGERKGVPALAKIAPHALDRENGNKLWNMTEELVGINSMR